MAFTDTDIYLEAKPGDKGNHVDPVLWLSEDLIISAPTLNVAKPAPTVNKVQVRIHRKGSTAFPANSFVRVEVFVGNPSLAMSRTTNTTRIVNKTVPVTDIVPDTTTLGGTAFTYDWTVGGTTPEAPGHKCLIAQCYPTANNTPDPTFDLKEQHTAQHNIAIEAAPAGPGGGNFRFNMLVANENSEQADLVVVRAVADLDPNERVLNAIRPFVELEPAFQGFHTVTDFRRLEPVEPVEPGGPIDRLDRLDRLDPTLRRGPVLRTPTDVAIPVLRTGLVRDEISATRIGPEALETRRFIAEIAPKAFALENDDFSDIVMRDFSNRRGRGGLFGRRRFPNFESRVELEPDQVTNFTFNLDLSNAVKGKGQIYHFSQTNQAGVLQGGLTLVVVPT